ncbi:hypothetical protein AB0G67_44120 [Streptomyces sp. NPDC021056]|uniref:hypothetical protein n=1 Tax=Streptomyces sp. NPDC021056 TaxID=3155012 RepID=UPI0033D1384D
MDLLGEARQPRRADNLVDHEAVVGGDATDWKVMDEKEVREEPGKGKLFGARVVPDDFTSCTCALIGTAAENASL